MHAPRQSSTLHMYDYDMISAIVTYYVAVVIAGRITRLARPFVRPVRACLQNSTRLARKQKGKKNKIDVTFP